MLASTILRTSLVLISLVIPCVVAAPGSTIVVTPYGERPSTDVHIVPDGMHPCFGFRKTILTFDTSRISQGLGFAFSAKKSISLIPPAMSLTLPPSVTPSQYRLREVPRGTIMAPLLSTTSKPRGLYLMHQRSTLARRSFYSSVLDLHPLATSLRLFCSMGLLLLGVALTGQLLPGTSLGLQSIIPRSRLCPSARLSVLSLR